MSEYNTQFNESPAVIPPVSNELELLARRELALRATDAIAEVLERDVTVRGLERMVMSPTSEAERITGVRALRCVETIARSNSPIARAVGEAGIYNYVEGVIQYGADEKKFLELMNVKGLSAEQATGLYALRSLLAEYTNGQRQGFPFIEACLHQVGVSLAEAADDPDGTIDLLDKAGLLVSYKGGRTFNSPILAPNLADRSTRLVEDDPDGTLSASILEAQLEELGRPTEEIEGADMQSAYDIVDRIDRIMNS